MTYELVQYITVEGIYQYTMGLTRLIYILGVILEEKLFVL